MSLSGRRNPTMKCPARSAFWKIGTLALLLGLGAYRPAAAGIHRWTPIGPPAESRVLSLVMAPSNGRIVYAGLAEGGVERSDDGGASFRPASFGLGDPYVAALAVDPHDPDRVYAGTPSGLYRSADGGATWQSARPVLPLPVHFLATDPRRSGTVYAGTENGIYRSLDGGVRWQLLTGGLPLPIFHFDVTALAVDPLRPRRLFMAHFGYHAQIHASTDGGTTWFSLRLAVVHALAVDPVHDGTVWAASTDGVLKSTDGGQHWTLVRGVQGQSLAIDPTAPDTIYVGTADGVERTRDGGATWANAGSGLPGGPVYALVPDPSSPGHLLAATQGAGVYRSDDRGDHWRPGGRGLVNTFVAAMAIAASPSALFVGGPGYGILRSLDRGASWSQVLAGGSIGAIVVAPADERTIYAQSLLSQALVRSSDGGSSWETASTVVVGALAVDPADPVTVYATTPRGLEKSTDGGATWSVVFQGSVFDVAADPLTPGTVYLVTGLDVWRSRDGGGTWRKLLTGGVPTIHAHLLRRVFVAATTPRTIFAADEEKVAGSFDGGRNWRLLVGDRENPLAFAVDPLDPGVLYLGTELGVEQSTDGGQTWRRFDRGLYGRGLTQLLFDPLDPGRLYAATSGAGVFAYDFAP
jgi:photosystem II stability/assembly factor-like uncharacterized protein